MKNTFWLLAIFFCGGILCSGVINIPFSILYICVLFVSALSPFLLKNHLAKNLVIFLIIFFLGVIVLKGYDFLPQNHISKLPCDCFREDCSFKGIISAYPERHGRRVSFIFELKQIQYNGINHITSGKIMVWLKSSKSFAYGDELLLKGKLRFPYPNQGYRNYLLRQKISYIMRLNSEPSFIKTGKNKGFILKRLSFWLKERCSGIINKRLSMISSAILSAMLLGDKTDIPKTVNQMMMRNGTLHILVVSGFNVGIVLFIVMLILKILRIPRRPRIFLSLFFLVIYCLMSGASNPVVRATVMAIVFMLAFILQREPDPYNCCATAAFSILLISPRQLFDAGFQLSFASVISIIYFYPKIKSFMPAICNKVTVLRFFADSLIVSFVAWLGTMGFILYYFNIFSPITVISNILIVPLATIITLCGFSLVFAELLFAPLAVLFAYSIEFIIAIMLKITWLLTKIPFAYFSF